MARKEVGTGAEKKPRKSATKSKTTQNDDSPKDSRPKRRYNHRTKSGRLEAQAEAVRLRKLALSYDEIAKRVGYADHSGAYHAVKRALLETQYEEVEEFRAMELARLDAMAATLIPLATASPEVEPIEMPDGSIVHALVPRAKQLETVDRLLRIMERRARYVPDAEVPKTQEITGSGGAPFFVELLHPLPDPTQEPTREEDLRSE